MRIPVWILCGIVGVVLGAAGCEAVAAGLRMAADVAGSPGAKAGAQAVADSLGLGWLWGLLGGAAGMLIPAAEGARRAKRNGAFVDVMAEQFDAAKQTMPEHVKPLLQLVANAMARNGLGDAFDAFLAKLGRNA